MQISIRSSDSNLSKALRSALLAEEPSRLHFSLPGHNKHHLQGLGIEQVRSKDPFVIKAREHKYIQLFDSYRRGLNQEP